ncbi:MAG: ATP-binding protein, partial [Desulfobacterales bacterium]|nr:ATP-binding protein [Desulfobacterales bacterium]
VETLLSGAMDNPEEAKRFLGIIEKHVNRLTAIVEDLLQLSWLESKEGVKQIQLISGKVAEVIQSAIQTCQPKADEKRIRIDNHEVGNYQVNMDSPYLEEALVNILDNAIKYSKEDSQIWIKTVEEADGIMISVRDQGIGIPKTQLSRIFERFYRVDRARSRKLGGTGLGLSIVKHIVQAHGGKVTVESTLGQGSTFHIHLSRVS